ncbi:MAG: LytTR family DNA-binding domain-containing protein, partial [Saprospiraceae bacterium]
IVLVSGENILTCKTLKSWVCKIGTNVDFVRPHRSFLVNKNHIMSYQSKPRKMILSGSQEVPLARSFKVNDLNDPNNE